MAQPVHKSPNLVIVPSAPMCTDDYFGRLDRAKVLDARYIVFQVMIVLDLLLSFAKYPGFKWASYVDDKAGSFFLIQKHNIWLVVVQTVVSLDLKIS